MNYEAPRPPGGASRKGNFILIVPLTPLQGGACGALAGQLLMCPLPQAIPLGRDGALAGQIVFLTLKHHFLASSTPGLGEDPPPNFHL